VGGRDWAFTGELPSKEGPPHKVHLCEAAYVRVERHVKIQGAANPYDPAWESYFEERLAFRMEQTLTGQRSPASYGRSRRASACAAESPDVGDGLGTPSRRLARPRRQRYHRQLGVTASELSSAGSQSGFGSDESRVPRGAFVKA